MEWILPLVGGLGIGSLLKSLVDHFISRRDAISTRLYQEKREAYLGLLDALHKAAVAPSDANAKAYALWQTRCNLFGHEDVSRLAQAMVDTGRKSPERDKTFRALVAAMRNDLER